MQGGDKNPPSKSPSHSVKQHDVVNNLLRDLHNGDIPKDYTPGTQNDAALNCLNIKDLPKLRRAQGKLVLHSTDKHLDICLRSRITAMVGTLNLYLDPEASYTWCQASLVASKVQGHGVHHAQTIHTWIHQFLNSGKLPLHRYGSFHPTVLDDEDFSCGLTLYLLKISKNSSVRAQDIVDYMQLPDVQEKLGGSGLKSKISLWTAQRWLRKIGWRYGRKRNGMYIDGHEREDVVKYRKAFVTRWAEYEKRMTLHDNNGNTVSIPNGFAVEQVGRFRFILLTHDESTFFADD